MTILLIIVCDIIGMVSRSQITGRETLYWLWMLGNSWKFGLLLILTLNMSLSANDSTSVYWQNLWESKQARVVVLFAQFPGHDNMVDSLYIHARQAYEEGQYQLAYELLKMVWELVLADTLKVDSVDFSQTPSPSHISYEDPFSLQLELGIDESVYQTQSVFITDVTPQGYRFRSPYLAMQWNFSKGSLEQSFVINQRLRLDTQYINYFLRNYWLQQKEQYYTRLEINSNYYHDFRDSSNQYIDFDISGIVGNRYGFPFLWYLRGFFRLKRYISQQFTFPQINHTGIEINGEYSLGWYHRFGVLLGNEHYREFNPQWNWYTSYTSHLYYRYSRTLQQYGEVGVRLGARRFNTSLDTLNYTNQFLELETSTKGEIPLWRNISSRWTVNLRWRRAETPDAFTPDERIFRVEWQPRWYWNTVNFVGIGGYLEQGDYRARGTVNTYVQSFNRKTQGVTVSFNYISTTNRNIFLEVQWGYARYPSGEANPLPSMYSDARSLALNGMLWWPLNQHIQLQGFVSYNSEQSLTYQNTASYGTTFSLSLLYRW